MVYLTFDDGPHPVATPIILNALDKFKIKATFFCVGNKVEKYPEIFQRIQAEGHAVANHSYSHRSGWNMSTEEFIMDVRRASAQIQSTLFRPPYGRLTPMQFSLLKFEYKIIMWDVLSKDYDQSISDDEVIHNVTGNISRGSIVVLHDNDKTAGRIELVLSGIISQLQQQGWSFDKM